MTAEPNLLLMLGTGAITGVFAGIFGVGGGIILVPLLIFFFGFSQQSATGTSLVALLLPVGFFGAYEYYRNGFLSAHEIKSGLLISMGMFFGAYFGAKIGSTLPQDVFRKVFSVILLGVAIRLWR